MSAMHGTLVIVERAVDGVSRHSLEVIAYAQALGDPVRVLFPGIPDQAAADLLRAMQVEALLTCAELELCDAYDDDVYVEAIVACIAALNPRHVLLPHSYTARDRAPRLAARLRVSLVSDCIAIEHDAQGYSYIRQLFQGRTLARVRVAGEGPVVVTLQAGIGRAESVARGGAAPVTACVIEPLARTARAVAEAPFRESARNVDLTRARILVAVGRGIKSAENIALARRLADLLGAELAASRAVCDEGWLPIERQVGSSGQTVAPALYIALGISGAVQHLVGMKGADTIVAINKDASAPIFDVADYGIVGDLFEVVPALIQALENP
jgi:electron transfer flavoprotein alpha subunit